MKKEKSTNLSGSQLLHDLGNALRHQRGHRLVLYVLVSRALAAAGLPALSSLLGLLLRAAAAGSSLGLGLGLGAGSRIGELHGHGVVSLPEDLVDAPEDRVDEAVVLGHVDRRDVGVWLLRLLHGSCNAIGFLWGRVSNFFFLFLEAWRAGGRAGGHAGFFLFF